MATLFLQGDGYIYHGLGLLFESSLAISFEDTGTGGLSLNYLFLEGTTSVSIHSSGDAGGFNELPQLAEVANVLTTVTLKGSEPFTLGSPAGASNAGDGVVVLSASAAGTLSPSSLKLIDASTTTSRVEILAGATNTSGAGDFRDGASLNANITISYTGLAIKGGLGNDVIENDAKNGIVTAGNGTDHVFLGGAGAKATLGTGTGDVSGLGRVDGFSQSIG